ncbi:DUF4242 domain-containing protein [filamentous cyanobacterium LEGE 11480]|uniref:DUF4242 domain-containing protein n=1 Tax=Romeriopsis navalis LEGE 11480 TaxID=2777977 RepID=A0A928Z3B5_9CYAN|nr:DUF4242 domain-containing protein [Romeriopsis navalis]MBE9029013.1 DUF4242 domain-containing protein [Romeriopsis navalis LEGE 11480]
MSLVIVETLSDAPLTPDEPTETDFRILSCVTERQGEWRYSLLSNDRRRMICTFDAPDAESIRDSYRKAGGFFSQVWTAEAMKLAIKQSPRNQETLKVFEVTYPNELSAADREATTQKLMSNLTHQGVEWVQSYVSKDRSKLICELNAPDNGVVESAHEELGLSCDRMWPAMLIAP